ncbi:DMT family transporter [Aliiroseovarius crassostreae]|uniref:DMT family transporter n=1 Tax=Aliiroseovarius crassostreae TaxID=154981 RepID=UPI00220F57C0|nr:DMT family transporter [Aliiroseovarius crassostreae]UWQ05993.1 DMT family transporter [Aliiroseovarius crassostreae]
MTATTRAAIWMSGAILSFSAMAVAGRMVSAQHDTFELMLYRSVVGFVVVLGYAALSGRLSHIGRDHLPRHVLRNLAHFTGQNLWFYALTLIPLAQVFALEFTSPLWVVILAPFLLQERLTGRKALAAGVGFLGILLIARPDSGLSLGTMVGALAAIAFALTAILTRKLTQSANRLTILFWLTAMQLVFGLVCAGWDGNITLPALPNIPWFILIGLAGLLAHLCLTSALSLAPASLVIPMDFVRLPLIAAVGALFYGEPVGFGLLAGSVLIVLGNLINLGSFTNRLFYK